MKYMKRIDRVKNRIHIEVSRRVVSVESEEYRQLVEDYPELSTRSASYFKQLNILLVATDVDKQAMEEAIHSAYR
ncbi:hypothetical protein K8I28_11395 [bacterium]|nr:hypothetical protein [bacterium]